MRWEVIMCLPTTRNGTDSPHAASYYWRMHGREYATSGPHWQTNWIQRSHTSISASSYGDARALVLKQLPFHTLTQRFQWSLRCVSGHNESLVIMVTNVITHSHMNDNGTVQSVNQTTTEGEKISFAPVDCSSCLELFAPCAAQIVPHNSGSHNTGTYMHWQKCAHIGQYFKGNCQRVQILDMV